MSLCRRVGARSNLTTLEPATPHCFARRENFPLLKSIKFQQTMAGQHGGRRKGAGRPAGARNRPVLIHGLPETADPLQWLLNAMRHEALPPRLRMAAAKAMMPFMHPPG